MLQEHFEDSFQRERGFSIKHPFTYSDNLFISIEKPVLQKQTLRSFFKPKGRPRKN